ncbi:hypothetical protein BJ165DRAFT_1448967, partial [Panaeolus papilionaceus]
MPNERHFGPIAVLFCVALLIAQLQNNVSLCFLFLIVACTTQHWCSRSFMFTLGTVINIHNQSSNHDTPITPLILILNILNI